MNTKPTSILSIEPEQWWPVWTTAYLVAPDLLDHAFEELFVSGSVQLDRALASRLSDRIFKASLTQELVDQVTKELEAGSDVEPIYDWNSRFGIVELIGPRALERRLSRLETVDRTYRAKFVVLEILKYLTANRDGWATSRLSGIGISVDLLERFAHLAERAHYISRRHHGCSLVKL